MDPTSSIAVVSVFGLVHLAGLASAWLARASEGSRCQTSCQWLFISCLGAVGLATIVSHQLGAGLWVISGTTLSVMVVAATYDVGHGRETTVS